MRPLLIAQGRNDPRVPMREAEQMVDALKRHDIPVGFVVYGDEGHGFVRPANRISSIALTEAFLARWIGGRCEPTHDDEIAGTTCDIVEGADLLPGQVARAG
ncbi:alpha/beta hydrolase family protein [Sphingomonas hankookensis]|uniref:alpha/beta hydrolase family protein n=1 Tax=Sphingomonas hankookensis TaxID=563996 RepID=UPI003D303D1C